MLDPDVVALATSRTFAALTTLRPDGSPSTQVMWVDSDGENILINTEIHRAKYRDMIRDGRVAVLLPDHENPYRYAEVRGRVVGELRGPEALAHINALSQRYGGKPYPAENITSERVILTIEPTKVYTRGMGN